MYGIDLDGVLLCDIVVESEADLKMRRERILPLFQPHGEYIIITGRPMEDLVDTNYWIIKNLIVQPIQIYHACPSLDMAAKYKSEILNAHTKSLTFFMESDRVQTQYLRQNTRTKIYNFSEYIESGLPILGMMNGNRRMNEY